MKIVNIEKMTNTKFLNLYKLTYLKENGDVYDYYLSSRRSLENLEIKKQKTDAVRAVPYIKKDDKIYVVLIKEFRHAINNFIYGIPAGLVDGDEKTTTAIKRELLEEIGASVIHLQKVLSSSYSSAGLTDETIECFYAEVVLSGKQKLEETEKIKYEIVELDKLPSKIKNNKFDLQSALLLKSFFYETKFKELER